MSIINKLQALPEDKQLSASLDLLKELYKSSIYLTTKHLLGYKDVTKNTHGSIIQTLESTNKRKLIVCPRGAFKSTLCVISYTIWLLIRNPNERILIDSEIYTNSKNFLREIKKHLESERLTRLFGEFKGERDWTEGSFTIKQRTEHKKESSVTAGGVATTKVGAHFTTIIHDDLNSNKNSATQDGRQKVIEHYRLNTSILEPDGTMVVVGTRYASDDIIGWILENELELNSDGSDF